MIYLILFLEFLKIGLFSFGGGLAMIPLFKETVLAHEWMTEELFYDFIGICESTPGPIAVNLATYIGTSVAGPLGGALATFGVILPAFLIILLTASILIKITNNKHIKGAIAGIQPAVIGFIFSAGVILSLNIFKSELTSFSLSPKTLGIFLLLVLFEFTWKKQFKKSIHTVPLIIFSAIFGVLAFAI